MGFLHRVRLDPLREPRLLEKAMIQKRRERMKNTTILLEQCNAVHMKGVSGSTHPTPNCVQSHRSMCTHMHKHPLTVQPLTAHLPIHPYARHHIPHATHIPHTTHPLHSTPPTRSVFFVSIADSGESIKYVGHSLGPDLAIGKTRSETV